MEKHLHPKTVPTRKSCCHLVPSIEAQLTLHRSTRWCNGSRMDCVHSALTTVLPLGPRHGAMCTHHRRRAWNSSGMPFAYRDSPILPEFSLSPRPIASPAPGCLPVASHLLLCQLFLCHQASCHCPLSVVASLTFSYPFTAAQRWDAVIKDTP